MWCTTSSSTNSSAPDADKGYPQRQLVDQIEWPAELVPCQSLDLLIAVISWQISQIPHLPGDLDVVGKHLVWLAFGVHPVAGAQNGMTGNDFVESRVQTGLVESARQSVGDTDVQRGVGRVHGLQEPHPALTGRQGVTLTGTHARLVDPTPGR